MSAHLLLLFIFFRIFYFSSSDPPSVFTGLPNPPLSASLAFSLPPDHPFPSNHSSNSPSILQSSPKLTSPSGEGRERLSLPSSILTPGSPFAPLDGIRHLHLHFQFHPFIAFSSIFSHSFAFFDRDFSLQILHHFQFLIQSTLCFRLRKWW